MRTEISLYFVCLRKLLSVEIVLVHDFKNALFWQASYSDNRGSSWHVWDGWIVWRNGLHGWLTTYRIDWIAVAAKIMSSLIILASLQAFLRFNFTHPWILSPHFLCNQFLNQSCLDHHAVEARRGWDVVVAFAMSDCRTEEYQSLIEKVHP